jgi:hypothetical protein
MKINLFLTSAFLLALSPHKIIPTVTIDQKWDSTNGWTTVIGSGANPSTVITPLPNGNHYLSTDLCRNNANNGMAGTYSPLGSAAIPAGNVTPFWLQVDFRYTVGSLNYVSVPPSLTGRRF